MNKYLRCHSMSLDDLKHDYFNNIEKIKKIGFFKKILLRIRGH